MVSPPPERPNGANYASNVVSRPLEGRADLTKGNEYGMFCPVHPGPVERGTSQ